MGKSPSSLIPLLPKLLQEASSLSEASSLVSRSDECETC